MCYKGNDPTDHYTLVFSCNNPLKRVTLIKKRQPILGTYNLHPETRNLQPETKLINNQFSYHDQRPCKKTKLLFRYLSNERLA